MKHQNRTEPDQNSASMSEPTFEETVPPETVRALRIRGLAMSGAGTVMSLLFTLLVPLWYRAWIELNEPIAMVVIGVVIMLLSIPFHLLGSGKRVIGARWLKSFFYCLSVAINTVGTSLCMSAYSVHHAVPPDFSVLFAGMLVTVVLYVVLCLLMLLLPTQHGLWTGVMALLALALLIVSIVFWVRNDAKTLFSFCFFNLVEAGIIIITLHFACSEEESPWLRFMSFASFGLLIVVASVVLIILMCAAGGDGCDCDCGDGCCDGCDCGCGGGNSKARKRQ